MLGRQIEVECHPFHASEATAQRLHPLAIVPPYGPLTYLVATAFDYDDIRLYALHRITAARLTEEPAKRNSDFDLDAYTHGVLQFGDGETILAEAHIKDDLDWVLQAAPISDDILLEADETEWIAPEGWRGRDFALKHFCLAPGVYS